MTDTAPDTADPSTCLASVASEEHAGGITVCGKRVTTPPPEGTIPLCNAHRAEYGYA